MIAGKKPRIAGIERAGGEGAVVEGGATLGFAQDAPGCLMSQPGTHRQSDSAIAARVVDSVPHPGMGKLVEGEGHGAFPAMGELHVFKIREDLHQPVPQPAGLPGEAAVPRAGTAETEQARAVGAQAHGPDVVA